ncbi:MAG: efflux RND transporter periplasmic adaptor subunit [Gammaproteobacteria bacterium]|nr:efflux RND transporter periplasmic adaptor subunit [Gammaproteobacteria bacterium]
MFALKFSLSLILAASLLLTGCDNNSTTSQPFASKQRSGHRVETRLVQSEYLAQTLNSTCVLVAQRQVGIYSQGAGRIDALPYYPGDRVKKGAIIARLDNRLLQAELEKVQAEVKQAHYQLAQLQKLIKQQLVAQERLIEAETSLKITQAEQKRLQILLENTRLTAPFTGIITQRLAEPGDIAEQRQLILGLIDPDSLYAKTEVPERFIQSLQTGHPAQLRIDALGNDYYPASINRIHPLVNPQTLKMTLELKLDTLPAQARAGQFCRIRYDINPHQRLLIPLTALRSDEQGSFVFIVNPQQKAQRISVKEGGFFNDKVEILEGLDAGTTVVTRGFLSLSDGMDVITRK